MYRHGDRQLPLYYVYDRSKKCSDSIVISIQSFYSYHISLESWKQFLGYRITGEEGNSISIRGSSLDAVFIGLWLTRDDGDMLSPFDGFEVRSIALVFLSQSAGFIPTSLQKDSALGLLCLPGQHSQKLLGKGTSILYPAWVTCKPLQTNTHVCHICAFWVQDQDMTTPGFAHGMRITLGIELEVRTFHS